MKDRYERMRELNASIATMLAEAERNENNDSTGERELLEDVATDLARLTELVNLRLDRLIAGE